MPGHHDDDDKGGAGGNAATRTTTTTTDQLVAAARQITTLRSQIDAILANWIDPPNPDKPLAVSSTSTILTEAANITTTANAIMARLRA
jgi:hypothetical protein